MNLKEVAFGYIKKRKFWYYKEKKFCLYTMQAYINIEKSINMKSETHARACMVLTANSSSYPTHVSERMSEHSCWKGGPLSRNSANNRPSY